MCAKAVNASRKQIKNDVVFKELRKLPNQFIILQNVFLRLGYKITHQPSEEILNSCQIDFVVFGPSGIFVIEAKDWDEYAFEEGVPYKEADKAGLCVYIKLKNHCHKRIPIYNIITTLLTVPEITYGRVKQLSLWDLSTFIYSQDQCLTKSDIRVIKRFFLRVR